MSRDLLQSGERVWFPGGACGVFTVTGDTAEVRGLFDEELLMTVEARAVKYEAHLGLVKISTPEEVEAGDAPRHFTRAYWQ